MCYENLISKPMFFEEILKVLSSINAFAFSLNAVVYNAASKISLQPYLVNSYINSRSSPIGNTIFISPL